MLEIKYSTENNQYNFTIKIENADELTLSEAFSHFINLTRWMGYHEGSWQNIINELSSEEEGINDAYNIWEWATDILDPITTK